MPRTFTAKAAKALCFGVGMLLAMTVVGRMELGSAREGEPLAVAARAMSRAGQSCPHLASAVRLEDGSIQAMCADGERYRITTVNGVEVSLHCARARAMGISNC
jgi:hypothetical protein